jgi:hypothetical protein
MDLQHDLDLELKILLASFVGTHEPIGPSHLLTWNLDLSILEEEVKW